MSEIIIYEDAEGKGSVQVRLVGETVWQMQKQMSYLNQARNYLNRQLPRISR